MKKLISAVGLAAALVFLAGCSAPSEPAAPPAKTETEAEPAAEAAAEETEVVESDYAVTINGSELGEDYEGKPAIIVNFTFANNSDKASSFMFAVSAKAFQDGVELETAITLEGNGQDLIKEIKPGATIDVQQAYVLDGQSEVLVEVEELLSFDDDLIATKTFSVQ